MGSAWTALKLGDPAGNPRVAGRHRSLFMMLMARPVVGRRRRQRCVWCLSPAITYNVIA
jgi:hypothetical protein